ncbi:MAG: YggT family protein [Chloroflexi bacterium]|jgi:YggT family protein|uniref:YggT family protein n=1 Tax=Candidatus Chlorohelix allophototropha TaxID=3003348 RepID=A0A8T7M8X8_9CHLR|nr:YggT family protein [Chloroflexota bacterium]WJW68515.1 YggT family protein [Chloroflexota bacterium L227-S17]
MSVVFGIALVFLYFIWVMMFVAMIMSWIDPSRRFTITRLAYDVVDPLVAPIRRIIPPIGMLDISFIVAFILLRIVINFVASAGSIGNLPF